MRFFTSCRDTPPPVGANLRVRRGGTQVCPYITAIPREPTILHLRRQVVELQAHIRQLESELNVQHISRQLRLAQYRKVHFDVTWMELEFQE